MHSTKTTLDLSHSFASMGVSTRESPEKNLFVTPTNVTNVGRNLQLLGTNSNRGIQVGGHRGQESCRKELPHSILSGAPPLDAPSKKQIPLFCSRSGDFLSLDDGGQASTRTPMTFPAHHQGNQFGVPLLPDDDALPNDPPLSEVHQGPRVRVLPRGCRAYLFASSYSSVFSTGGCREDEADMHSRNIAEGPPPPRLRVTHNRPEDPSVTSPASKRVKISWPNCEEPCPERPPSLKMRVCLRSRSTDFVSSVL